MSNGRDTVATVETRQNVASWLDDYPDEEPTTEDYWGSVSEEIVIPELTRDEQEALDKFDAEAHLNEESDEPEVNEHPLYG